MRQQELERQKLSDRAVTRIGKAWEAVRVPKDTDPAANASLDAAAGRLNKVWLAARQNMASPDEFRAALEAWEKENYRTIDAVQLIKGVN